MKRDEHKRRFAARILRETRRPLGFIDVGSGGALKSPWSLLPSDRLKKHDIEPLGDQPICISDHRGLGRFHVAVDPRSSSLHPPSEEFIRRHRPPGLETERVINVQLKTLSETFGHLKGEIDVMDINVEGHDKQVLDGADAVFANNFMKLVKVEFELTEVWTGQGWFAEIDTRMRGLGYDLAALEVDYSQPEIAAGLRAGAEPIWGKAIYVASQKVWRAKARSEHFRDECLAGVCLYALFDLPARALEVAALAESLSVAAVPTPTELHADFKSLHGETSLAKRVWRSLPDQARAKIRALLRR